MKKPTIGFITTNESSDRNETIYGGTFKSNLPTFGKEGCDVKELDFNRYMRKFGEKFPDEHKEIIAESNEFIKEKKAPNIDIETEGSPGSVLRKFLKEDEDIKKLSGIAGQGNFYNSVGDNVNESPNRAVIEKVIFSIAREKGMPILGVCGTQQAMGYAVGAEITDDVQKLTGDDHVHKDSRGNEKPSEEAHDIYLHKDTMLASIAKNKDSDTSVDESGKYIPKKTNSLHTQAIINSKTTSNNISDGNLRICAEDKTGKIVEAMEQEHGSYVVLMQSHPEYLVNNFHKSITNSFAESASTYDNKKKLNDSFIEKYNEKKLRDTGNERG